MPGTTISATLVGVEARPVTVEVDVHRGLPKVTVVGLPDAAIQEARERIRSAVKNSGGRFPYHPVTISLSPAELRKEGAGFDLPVAVALLAGTGQVPDVFREFLIIGELNLRGDLQPTNGILVIAELARRLGRRLMVPVVNAAEAAMIDGVAIVPVGSLFEVMDIALSGKPWPSFVNRPTVSLTPPAWHIWPTIVGQAQAKRAATIAAAGHHNLLMIGPPGSGKTLIAEGLRELLPPLTEAEALAVTKIHSVAGLLAPGRPLVTERPFRQPHHTASVAALTGGGRIPKPGELSLAHHGLLFLDEFPEFSRDHIEALRQPLENGTVVVNRVWGAVSYPAACMLVAAMNPCPCGYLHDPRRACRCSPTAVARYQRRLSGPVLDRFDLFVHVPPVKVTDLRPAPAGDDPRPAVAAARRRQAERQAGLVNSRLRGRAVREFCRLDDAAQSFLHQAMDRLGFSMRAYVRILRVARTIADLSGDDRVNLSHLAEAVQYRPPSTGWI